jgi:hypothetical protein
MRGPVRRKGNIFRLEEIGERLDITIEGQCTFEYMNVYVAIGEELDPYG